VIERHVTAVVRAEADRVLAAVKDLSGYPSWSGIVLAAKAADDGAWLVDIGARLGPLRRSKRLRMVSADTADPWQCRFERQELDEREHSDWVLAATVTRLPEGAQLTMDLSYGGGMWLPGLDLVLDAEIRAAGRRLERHLA
jgi:hypothetical protein